MTIEAVLRSHFGRYPAMRIQDMYKLIHQAAMGSEHAITSVDGARQWMERELAEMGNGPYEPVIDPISDDKRIVRVHLRSFIKQGGNVDALLNAFILTANEVRGDTNKLEEYWEVAVKLNRFPNVQLEKFIKFMRTKNYPAVHHSHVYEHLYCPAYRVVLDDGSFHETAYT